MSRQALLVSAFLLFLNVSLVLCREDYQQYYSNHFSHHHRKSTPGDAVSTEAPVSSDEGVSASGGPVFAAVKSYGDVFPMTNDAAVAAYNTMVIVTIVSVFFSVASLIIGLIIIYFCGKKIGRKIRPGHIFIRPAVEMQPEQPSFTGSPHLTHNPPGAVSQKVPLPHAEQPEQKLNLSVEQESLL